jgi:fibronectin-binding autotransporter adhesin
MKCLALRFRKLYVFSTTVLIFSLNAETVSWVADGDGIWASDSNWSGAFPKTAVDIAIFPLISNSEKKISLSTNVYLSDIHFKSDSKYILEKGSLNLFSSIKNDRSKSLHEINSNIFLMKNILFATESDLLISGAISGAGGIIKTNEASLLLSSGYNHFEGETIIEEGRIITLSQNALSPNSKMTIKKNGMLSLVGFDNHVKTIAGDGVIDLGNAFLSIHNPDLEIFNGSIVGDGGIIKKGDKTLFLKGDQNSYTGKTIIQKGVITPLSDDSFSPLSTLNLEKETALNTNGFSIAVGGLEGSGFVFLNGENLALGFNNESTTFLGRIYGDAGLTKIGSGCISFAGFLTYSGATIIDQGCIQALKEKVLSNNSEIILSEEGSLDLNGFDNTVANIAGSGDIYLSGAELRFGNENTTGFQGSFKNSGKLSKIGSGGLILYGNKNEAPLDFRIEQGFVELGVDNAISSNSAFYLAKNATLNLNNFNLTISSLAGEGELRLGSSNLKLHLQSDSEFSGNITGAGGLEKSGEGKIKFVTPLNYSGNTKLYDGTIVFGANYVFPKTTNLELYSNKTAFLDLGSYDCEVATLSGDGLIYLGGGALSFGDDSYKIFSGNITGKGNLVKKGSGTYVLKGISSDYEGVTYVSKGKMLSQAKNSFSKNSVYHIQEGAILDLSGFDNQVRHVEGCGNLHLGAGCLSLYSDQDYEFLGSITSMKYLGSLKKSGQGTFLMKGDSSYWGDTFVEKGILKAGKENAFSPNSKLHIASYGCVDLNHFANKVSALSGDEFSQLDLTSKDLTVGGNFSKSEFKGSIKGSGNLIKSEGGELLLSGKNSFTGAICIEKDGLIAIRSASSIENVSKISIRDGIFRAQGNLNLNKTVEVLGKAQIETDHEFELSGNLSGYGTIQKNGLGNLYLTNAKNEFDGNFVINEGKVFTNSNLFFSRNTNLVFNENPKAMLSLSGENHQFGGLHGYGVIQLGGADILVASSEMNQFSGSIIGAKNFIKEGSGKFNLKSDQKFSGTTYVNNGLLAVNSKLDSDVLVATSGRLGGTGLINKSVVVYGVMAPGNSIGTLNVAGDYTQAAGSTYENEINPTQTDYLNVSGTLTINSPATLKVIADSGYYSPQTTYEIAYGLHGVVGQFSSVTTNIERASASLTYTPSSHPKYINLIFNLGSYESVAVGENNKNIAKVIDSINALSQSSWANALNALFFLNNSNLNLAYNSIGPMQYKALAIIAENNAYRVRQTISLRFQNLLDEVQCKFLNDCKNEKPRAEAWIDGIYNGLYQTTLTKNHNKQIGYSSLASGGSAGIDLRISENGYIGIMGAGTSTNVEFDDSHGRADVYTGYFAPYASYVSNHFFLNTSILVGFDIFKMKREIQYSGFETNAYSRHRGTEILAHADLGWNAVFESFTVRPFESIDFSWLHEKGFSESMGLNYNLNLEDAYPELLRNELGLNIATCFKLPKRGSMIADFKFSWVYEARVNGQKLKSYFLTNRELPFEVDGYFPNRSLFSPAVTLTANVLKDLLKLSLSYDCEVGNKYFDQSVVGQIEFSF